MQEYRGPDIQFQFYAPDINCSTNFLFVLNGEAAHKYTGSITWKKIKKRIDLDSPSLVTNSTVRQVTGNYANYGYCTSQNSNRNKSTTGHVMSALKPNSTVREIVDVFVALTTFASNTRPLWRRDNDHFASIDPDILTKFAHKIDGRNGLPLLHLAVTSVKQPCGCHNDGAANSKTHADVVCINMFPLYRSRTEACGTDDARRIVSIFGMHDPFHFGLL
jgi:hypothetical protein